MDDAIRTQVRRYQDVQDELDSLSRAGASSPSVPFIAVTTTRIRYPDTAHPNSIFAVQKQLPLGNLVEGATVTFSTRTDIVLAANVSGIWPPPGSQVLVESQGGRLVFGYQSPQC